PAIKAARCGQVIRLCRLRERLEAMDIDVRISRGRESDRGTGRLQCVFCRTQRCPNIRQTLPQALACLLWSAVTPQQGCECVAGGRAVGVYCQVSDEPLGPLGDGWDRPIELERTK